MMIHEMKPRACPGEADRREGSREGNASDHKARAPFRFDRNGKSSSKRTKGIAAFCIFGACASLAFEQMWSSGTSDPQIDQRIVKAKPAVLAQDRRADQTAKYHPSASPIQAQSDKSGPLSAISLVSLHVTRERPLFAASRRPPAPPVAMEAPKPPEPEPVPEKPDVMLVGVIYGLSLRLGLFVHEGVKSLIRARPGDAVHGWTVQNVERRAVTLAKANEQVRLELKLTVDGTKAAEVLPKQTGLPLRAPVAPIKPFATADR
jgi:hypothetical protein